jgi:hypothetical protein
VWHPNCPRCGKEFVQRAPRKNWLEGLARLLSIHPFRCQLCSYRFLALDWRFRPNFYRRREYVRMPARFPLTFTSQQMNGEGTVLNLSIKGCQIETDVPIVLGCTLSLGIRGTDGQPLFEVDAAVVQTLEGKQAGIEFLRIRNDAMDRLVGVMLYLYTGVKQ